MPSAEPSSPAAVAPAPYSESAAAAAASTGGGGNQYTDAAVEAEAEPEDDRTADLLAASGMPLLLDDDAQPSLGLPGGAGAEPTGATGL